MIVEQPLITFALFAYNQEDFIGEAIEGALSQGYSPLEIIISDDCSQDETFNIIKSKTEKYRGPHNVKICRNLQNLGLARHINNVFSMARGELIVMAAGDDISSSNRTERLVEKWIDSGKPSGIGSYYQTIDKKGKILEKDIVWVYQQQFEYLEKIKPRILLRDFINGKNNLLIGCVAAWSKDLWNKFGELETEVAAEDAILSFRSYFLNGIKIVNETLVSYRRHEKNTWSPRLANMQIGFNEFSKFAISKHYKHGKSVAEAIFLNKIKDITRALNQGLISNEESIMLKRAVGIELRINKLKQKWWSLKFIEKYHNINFLSNENYFKRILRFLPFQVLIFVEFVRWRIKL